MATNQNGARTLEGTVAAVNERGLRLEGRDGWLNYSKWAGELAPPARGQVVALTLDGSGVVRAVGPAEGAVSGSHQEHEASRETAIIRLAVIKAAAEFAAGRPDVKSGDVLAIAERWETWVTR
jgi:hypothetical protein